MATFGAGRHSTPTIAQRFSAGDFEPYHDRVPQDERRYAREMGERRRSAVGDFKSPLLGWGMSGNARQELARAKGLPALAAMTDETKQQVWITGVRTRIFLVSFTLLFFELLCIRWIPAYVR
ncbi:MAG: hypothetical protein WAO00_09330, partial [Chthoniobacterales bacterium]